MSGHVLRPEDRDYFLKALKATKKPALEHRRMNALLLLDDGVVPAVVARMLYLDERTIEEYRCPHSDKAETQSGADRIRRCAPGESLEMI